MKLLLVLIVNLVSFNLFAQEIRIFGKVIDKNKKGIPFCIIEIKDKYEGLYCDENGYFSFLVNIDSVKTFIFYVTGYDKQEKSINEFVKDSNIVELQEKTFNLREFDFVSRRGKKKDKILGRKKLKYVGGSYTQYGNKEAILLEPERTKKGVLKKVFIYITDEGIPDTKFRIHIYAKDSATQLPSKDLTDSNLIVQAKTGNEWVIADLSSKMIPIKDGIFISVEWISGNGNSMNEIPLIRNGNKLAVYNGQVLGLTYMYGLQSRSYFNSTFDNSGWQYRDPKNYDFKIYKMTNPMIYCTYTYYK